MLVSDLPFMQTVKPLASHAIELGDCAIWRWGGGGGVLNLMGRAKVKLGCRVREGGARCQFFKHRGGLQVILIFKWYIIYSN